MFIRLIRLDHTKMGVFHLRNFFYQDPGFPVVIEGMQIEGMQIEAGEACNNINLGRMSKMKMPDEVIMRIMDFLMEPEPRYRDVEGKTISFWLRLWELRTPGDIDTDNIHRFEAKRDVLKILVCTKFSQVDLQDCFWINF